MCWQVSYTCYDSNFIDLRIIICIFCLIFFERNDFIVTTSPSSKLSSLSTDVFQRVRQASLVSRFGDLFARDRMDGMDVLYNHCDDHELNQKIVFTCVQVLI